MQVKWGVHCVASEEAVDILMDGFAFRLSILYEKDRTLINKERLGTHATQSCTCSFESQVIPSDMFVGPSALLLRLGLRP